MTESDTHTHARRRDWVAKTDDPGEGEATVRIYLTKELRQAFRLACLTRGESMAAVMRKFMSNFSNKNS